jgi:hypothetical protein
MQAIRQHSLQILTKGQKAAIKSEAQKQQIEAEKSHKDQVMKAAIAFINKEVSENLIRDMVEDFSQKGYASYNYYIDTTDFEAELPGGVIELPKDLEKPTQWDRETKTQVPITFTINRSLRTKSLREYVQKILDEDFPGFSIRIFAEDFQNEEGDPNKFTVKLSNSAGKPKRGGKGKGKGKPRTQGKTRSLDEFEAEKAKTQEALNK